MGDFWVDSDDGSRWVWKGLRWEPADDDVFLAGVLDFIAPYPEAFADGKLWIHYTPVEPLFRGDGDLWLNRTATGVSTFSSIEEASMYNKSTRSWTTVSLADIPQTILKPQESIEAFIPEFCTKAETSAYILTSGQVGSAVIGEFTNDRGYSMEATADSGRSRTIELTVAVTSIGESAAFVSIVDGDFDQHHIQLQPSGGLSTNWLFISHTMNYTVTYVQTGGPAADARETSYNEIGGFALGNPVDWIQFRFVNDQDLDNDGIVDACDDDIDADNDENPVQGHPEHCPGVGRFVNPSEPLSHSAWISANDENGDGVHDGVNDRDIDGDGVPNLIDGQGHSAEDAFAGANSLADIPELWTHASELAVLKCGENYKANDPSFAAFDCEQARAMTDTPPTNAQAWCEQVRYLDQLIWLEKCAAPERFEGGQAMFEERDPVLPLLSMLGLGGLLLIMRKPNELLMRLRSLFLNLGSEEYEKDVKTPWSWCSFAAEVIGRLVGIGFRLGFFILSTSLFFSTFAENQQPLLIPFTFTIGGAVMIMSGIALLVSVSEILGIRPETRVPRADGLVDLGLLLFSGIMIYIALHWVLVEGWLVGAITLLMIMSGVKRLLLAGLQLTRTDNIQHDRLKLVVKGRQGWMTATLVALTIALVSIPISVHIPFVWSDFTSSEPYKAGLRAAFWGSVYVVGYTMLFAIPLSIGAAIWLEEYAPNNRLRRTIQALITNLAGVPAIVFGLFGLAMFLTDRGIGLGLGGTVMTAGMTMATMAMPTIVISSQEALRAVPPSLRNGAFGLGCTKWQVTKDHVLPHAMPGMMTGTILAMSRIMGEAAPLILVGAVASVFTEPDAFFYVSYQVTPSLDGLLAWFPGIEPHLQNMPLWADRGPFSSDPSEYVLSLIHI